MSRSASACVGPRIGAIRVVAGGIPFIIPSVVSQSPQIADQTGAGLTKVQQWLAGPLFRISQDQIADASTALTNELKSSASSSAAGVFAGVTTALGVIVGLATTVFLVFFFLKDRPRFLPWMERSVGERVGGPLTEVLLRTWKVFGSFIRTQALVSLVDALLIGAGPLILGVPLALPLIVLIIIIVVQQLEGNVLQPVLQSRSMNLHAAVVLLAVTAGGSLYGITGAFLAVPVVSVVSVIWRFLVERMDARAQEAPESPVKALDDGDGL